MGVINRRQTQTSADFIKQTKSWNKENDPKLARMINLKTVRQVFQLFVRVRLRVSAVNSEE